MEMMNAQEAAQFQHLHASFYTVWMIDPQGKREYLGISQRKSGAGLVKFLNRESVQHRILQFPDAQSLTFKKKADCLIISNGWKVAFGGTLRQESAAVSGI